MNQLIDIQYTILVQFKHVLLEYFEYQLVGELLD